MRFTLPALARRLSIILLCTACVTPPEKLYAKPTTVPLLPDAHETLVDWARDLGIDPLTLPENMWLLAMHVDTAAQEQYYNQLTYLGKAIHQVQGWTEGSGLSQVMEISEPYAKALGLYAALCGVAAGAKSLKIKDMRIEEKHEKYIDFLPSVGTIAAMVFNKTLFYGAAACERNPIGLIADEFGDSYRLARMLGVETATRSWNAACGTRHKTTLPIKPTSEVLAPEVAQELLPLFICAQEPTTCFNVKLKFPRGLFINQSTFQENKQLAQGVAGALNEWAVARGGAQAWKTYEIHASELLSNKPINKIMSTLHTFDHVVLIIHDFEWLYAQTDRNNADAAIRSAILCELKKLMSDDSRDSIVVILTSTVAPARLTTFIPEPSLWYSGKLSYWSPYDNKHLELEHA